MKKLKITIILLITAILLALITLISCKKQETVTPKTVKEIYYIEVTAIHENGDSTSLGKTHN